MGIILLCKKYGSEDVVKSGIVDEKQRYKCKKCNCNFREGDLHTNEKVAAKKALCILLYAMAKGSYHMIGRILGVHHSLIYRWIKEYGESLPEPEITGDIQEMEFDEM